MTAWIAQCAIDGMITEADARFPDETGGVLVGYWASENEALVIMHAVGPGREAQHSRMRFLPDPQFHEKEVARIYEASGRRHTYLGDWHTHPKGTVTLSRLDSRTLGRIARARQARAPRPLMLILAGGPNNWDVAVWRGTVTKLVHVWSAIRCDRLEYVPFVS
jgi:integrative and conjugative element protein (TIGR02256 family)